MSKADTHFSNGVLTVTIPNLAKVPPSSRKLEIRTAEAVEAADGQQPSIDGTSIIRSHSAGSSSSLSVVSSIP
jgi:hypothetical protein